MLGGEKKTLGRFAVGINSPPDADLWQMIHQLAHRELPQQPITHPLYRPRAPWCATVHHTTERLQDTATADQLGALERGVAGECVVDDFPTPGETVTLEWQQTQQNFVMTDLE